MTPTARDRCSRQADGTVNASLSTRFGQRLADNGDASLGTVTESTTGFPVRSSTPSAGDLSAAAGVVDQEEVVGVGAARAVQSTASSANSQKWTLIDAGGSYYELRNVNSTLVASVAQSSTANGAAPISTTNSGRLSGSTDGSRLCHDQARESPAKRFPCLPSAPADRPRRS